MATESRVEECPNCEGMMDVWTSNGLPEEAGGQCPHCGFYYETKSGYHGLEMLNSIRESWNGNGDFDEEHKRYLAPLKKLPKQNKEIA